MIDLMEDLLLYIVVLLSLLVQVFLLGYGMDCRLVLEFAKEDMQIE